MKRTPWARMLNRTPRVIVDDFAPDPIGHAMFIDLSEQHQRGISGLAGSVYVGDKGSGSAGRTFNGDLARNVQQLMGAAALALHGGSAPTTPTTGTIGGSLSQGALNDPALRVFAARARRQSAGILS